MLFDLAMPFLPFNIRYLRFLTTVRPYQNYDFICHFNFSNLYVQTSPERVPVVMDKR